MFDKFHVKVKVKVKVKVMVKVMVMVMVMVMDVCGEKKDGFGSVGCVEL